MSACPVGLFDSGIGGLSIARHVKAMLPDAPLLYLADSQFAPYGDKSPEQVRRRCEAIVEFLLSQGAKVIVVACNTATVNQIQALRAKYNVPFVGVEPGIKPAVLQSKTKRVGVLVTQQTANSANLAAHIAQFSEQAMIKVQACPGLAEAVERLELEAGPLLSKFTDELTSLGIDQLVLGCTHYNFLAESIRVLMGREVMLIDTGLPVARQLCRVVADMPVEMKLHDSNLADQFYTSGDLIQFNKQLAQLWSYGKVCGQQATLALTLSDEPLQFESS